MMSHVRRLVVAVVATATLLLTSPQPAAASVVPPAGPGAFGSGTLGDWTVGSRAISAPARIQEAVDTGGVWLLGDSLTVADWADFAIRIHGQAGMVTAANGWSGRPTTPTIDALEAWANTYGLPPVVVIASGANDIFGPIGPTAIAAQIDRAATIVGPNTALIWVEPHISRWLQPTHIQVNDQRNSGWICGLIWEATARHPNLSVVPWARILSVAPDRVRVWLSDGVHTNTTGKAVRNNLMVNAVLAAG
jgi:hypothetical protein